VKLTTIGIGDSSSKEQEYVIRFEIPALIVFMSFELYTLGFMVL
jgi:hypothetical protein